MTCEELQTQLDAQVAAGDTEGADATRAQMLAQNCSTSGSTGGANGSGSGGPGGGTGN